ncbi:MAG: CopG family transcriptional regulator [Candidatus Aenigmarchaeota archaeon]|nr:CopG family transcriptional regulator [Candidatus Aenigmarchaeota archaeon]
MVRERKKRSKFTPISIPTPLFDNIREMIEGTGFPSVSSFATYILREVIISLEGKKKKVLTEGEKKKMEKRLRILGYLE